MISDSTSSNNTTIQALPQANYFAIIPANVRYCSHLSANAKLLYIEIFLLIKYKGKCLETNNFFADLYDVTARAVQRWISELSQQGFIEIHVCVDSISGREITISKIVGDK